VLLLVGKFYELFDYIDPQTQEPLTPIKRVCQIMNIALKEKPGHGPAGEIGLWGGVPEQSLHKFAQTLTGQGWTVVVVDQVKDGANRVTDRIPTRILSPGTHVEMAGQERMSVAGLYISQNKTAIAINDLTTGEVITYETPQADEILHLLQIYCVKEIIYLSETPDQGSGQGSAQGLEEVRAKYGIRCGLHLAPYTPLKGAAAEEYFRRMFRVKTLMPLRTALSLGDSLSIDAALFVLLRFVEDHFPSQSERLTGHTSYNPENHMRLSNNILEQLNIITGRGEKSVINLLDRTFSAIGKRALRERILRPITSLTQLQARWEQVRYSMGMEQGKRKIIERDLRGLYDIPRLHYKIASGSLSSEDILQLFHSYSASSCLIENLRDGPLGICVQLEAKISAYRKLFNAIFDESKAAARSNDAPVGFLTAEAGPHTFAIEQYIEKITADWQGFLEKFAKSLGTPVESFALKLDSSGEYYLEAPRSLTKVLEQACKATTNNPVKGLSIESKKSGPIRVTFEEFYEFSEKLRTSFIRLNNTLAKECLAACDRLWECVKGVQDAWIEWLGSIDVTFAFSAVGAAYDWCIPSLGDHLEIQGLRHPLLETQQTRENYVKHDISLDGGWLIYGVNASGKSSLMKAVGIAVILAQAGCPVPGSAMRIRPYDAAFSRIWNNDNIWAGLSSFAVEVQELAEILRMSSANSLVLGDEVCSGTESSSATSLVAATLEHLQAKGTHFMFATHLHDLMKVPGLLCSEDKALKVWHLRVITTLDGKLIYDRTLQPGSGKSTYGLEVAKAMGLPTDLMLRAYAIRRHLGGEASADEAPKSAWNPLMRRETCEHCKNSFVRGLEVHHIHERANGGGNSLRNLAVLCDACHDKHHANEITIAPLTQTSEGLERFSYTGPSSASASPSVSATAKAEKAEKSVKWSVDEMETIKATALKFKGRPLARISAALQEEHHIHITPAALKRLINCA
jgi:DNA mismatch repair protein MutS